MAIDLRPWLLKKFGFTQTVADPYPADSTNDLKPSRTEELLSLGDPAQAVADYARENLGKFLHSISVGITDAEQEADDSVVDCPQSKLVMMGYSQGAMVIHQTELLLKVDHPATFHHIIGTLLLADGDRVPDTRAHEFGTSLARAEGIQPYLHAIARRDVPLPGNTANICDAGDLICDFNLDRIRHFAAAARIHTGYAVQTAHGWRYSPALAAAANWLGRRLRP